MKSIFFEKIQIGNEMFQLWKEFLGEDTEWKSHLYQEISLKFKDGHVGRINFSSSWYRGVCHLEIITPNGEFLAWSRGGSFLDRRTIKLQVEGEKATYVVLLEP